MADPVAYGLIGDPSLTRAAMIPVGRPTFTDPGDDITEELGGLEFATPGLLRDPLMGMASTGAMLMGRMPVNPDVVTQTLLDTSVGSGLLSAATGAAPRGAVLGANVFHAGPHRFATEPDFPHGRPRLDKIGTGEGSQAYGYGFYSADSPKVAETYRTSLDNLAQTLDLKNPVDRSVGFLRFRHSKDEIKDQLKKEFGGSPEDLEGWYQAGKSKYKNAGTLYKLDIPDADVAKYLDYDKPLSEQPKHIQKAWAEFKKSELGVLADESLGGNISAGRANFSDPTGKDIYAAFVEGAAGKVGPEKFAEKADYKLASDVLRKAGIPGLKYFDQGSRPGDQARQLMQGRTRAEALKLARARLDAAAPGRGGGLQARADREHWGRIVEDLERTETRNYVTWDQDVLDRSKMLERDGVTLGANKAPTAALPGLLGKTSSELRAEANALRFPNENLNINAELAQSAKDYFGVTRSPNETGYIMQDGTRLDLSGRHYAGGYEKKGDRFVPEAGQPDYLGGNRAVDHRELYDLKGLKEGEHQWDAVEQLMRETGAVRYMPDTGFSIIDGQKVSDKQLKAIVSDFRKSGNPLTVDIDPVGGGSRAVSKTFDRPTVEGVQEFIELGANKGPTAALPGLLGDTASRMQRARDMGFDDEVLFHGTSDDVRYFDLDHPNRKDSGWLGTGVYLTDDPNLASFYSSATAGPVGPNVLPMKVKLKNPYNATLKDKERLKMISFTKGKEAARAAADEWTAELQKKGHDGVVLQYDPKDVGAANASKEVVVFDTRNVRSTSAKFDPAKADSADLLAANPATAALPGLLQDRSGNIDQRGVMSRTPRRRTSFPMRGLLGQRLYTATAPDGSI